MSDGVAQNNRKLHRHSFSSKMQLIQALDKLIVNRVENFKDDSYSCGIKTIFGNKELTNFISNLK